MDHSCRIEYAPHVRGLLSSEARHTGDNPLENQLLDIIQKFFDSRVYTIL